MLSVFSTKLSVSNTIIAVDKIHYYIVVQKVEMKKQKLQFYGLSAFFLCTMFLNAQEASFSTKEISLFKNGNALFLKQGYFPTSQQGSIVLDNLLFPKAMEMSSESHYAVQTARFPFMIGTLNFNAPNNHIKQIQRRNKPTDTDTLLQHITSFHDLLKANRGQKVKVILPEENRAFEGTIFSVSEEEVFLHNGKDFFLAPIKKIRDFKFIDPPVNTQKILLPNPKMSTPFTKPWEIQLDLENNHPNQLLELSYLRRGITWLPFYQIEFLPGHKANLDFKAEIINDLESFDRAKVNLIVGIPSFKYAYGEDPIVSGQSLANYLERMNNPPQQKREEDFMSQMRISSIQDDGNQVLASAPFGQEIGDLYYYQLKDLSLCESCRGMYTLASSQVDYEDIYTLRLTGNSEDYEQDKDQQNSSLKVWHTIRFKNTLGKPTTTGPVFFFHTQQGVRLPLGQQLMEYTPAEAMATTNVAITPEIQADFIDLEIDREDIDKDDYDYLVKVKGQIRLKNDKRIAVNLHIERPIIGDPKNSSIPWKTLALASNLNSQNKNNLVIWDLTLKPGEEKTIEYFYDFLAR